MRENYKTIAKKLSLKNNHVKQVLLGKRKAKLVDLAIINKLKDIL